MSNGSRMEQVVYDELKSLGWKIQAEPRFRVPTGDRQFYIPDFILYNEDNTLFGIVEVITKQSLCTQGKIEILQRIVQSSCAPVIMITNGFSYDIYVNGRFMTQTNICPSMDVCQFLIRRAVAQEGCEQQ